MNCPHCSAEMELDRVVIDCQELSLYEVEISVSGTKEWYCSECDIIHEEDTNFEIEMVE